MAKKTFLGFGDPSSQWFWPAKGLTPQELLDYAQGLIDEGLSLPCLPDVTKPVYSDE